MKEEKLLRSGATYSTSYLHVWISVRQLYDWLTTMATEDLIINDGCDWETVETVCERLPQFYAVPSLA